MSETQCISGLGTIKPIMGVRVWWGQGIPKTEAPPMEDKFKN
jgi:hypothetical protein